MYLLLVIFLGLSWGCKDWSKVSTTIRARAKQAAVRVDEVRIGVLEEGEGTGEGTDQQL